MLQRSGISVVELGFQIYSHPIMLGINFKVCPFPFYHDLLPNLPSWFDVEDNFRWHQIISHIGCYYYFENHTKTLVYFVCSREFWLPKSIFLLVLFFFFLVCLRQKLSNRIDPKTQNHTLTTPNLLWSSYTALYCTKESQVQSSKCSICFAES